MSVPDSDRFFFDVNGYVVLRGVLDSDALDHLNRRIDELQLEEISDKDARDFKLRWAFDHGQPFINLVDHEAVLPYLTEWLDPGVRIDHAYGLVYLPGEDVPLHGDDNVGTGGVFYRVEHGRISSGLTVVSWALTDCPPGAGGFRCVPGSHKASFPRSSDGAVDAMAIEVPVAAGDALIFTETLIHGGRWRGPGERRALFYKYTPGYVAHLSDVWTDEERDRLNLTERQRRMTLPPFETWRGEYRREPITPK